jgi:L-rhamnose mutarotase
MQRVVFKMQLKPGCAAEYKHRHDTIWPQLVALLKAKGVQQYQIALDTESNILFATLQIPDPTQLDTLPSYEIMQRWWAANVDIMDTHPDHAPVVKPLQEMFFME